MANKARHAQFRLRSTRGVNTYMIQARHSKKCFHVRGASANNRADVWTWTVFLRRNILSLS